MKSLISFLFINLCLLTPANSADLLGDLLRNAAIKNGYLDPKKVNTSFDLNKSLIGSQLFKAEFMSFNGNTSCQPGLP